MSRLLWKTAVPLLMRPFGPWDALFLVQPGAEVQESTPFTAEREVGQVGGLAVSDGLTTMTANQVGHGTCFLLGGARTGRRSVLRMTQ